MDVYSVAKGELRRQVVVLNAAKSEAGRKCAVELLDALGDVVVGVGRDA